MKIVIYSSANTLEEMAYLLDEIARQIRSGMTSGYHPGWELVS